MSGAVEARPVAEDLGLSIRDAAVNAARSAGERLRAHDGETLCVEKVGPHDLKLELDRICEKSILDIICERFPGHGVLSEEFGYLPPVEPFLWIVDPLDGTVNYFHRIPIFCISLACYRIKEEDDGRDAADRIRLPDGSLLGGPVIGVVYSPPGEELYVGIGGKGAYLNGKPLRVEPVSALSESVVGIAFNHRQYGIEYTQRLLPILLERARKVRCFGSTAMEIAYVASGRTGAFLQKGTHLWDFAAAAVVLREAGGVVEAEEFLPGSWRILASNPGISKELKKLAG